MSGALHGGRPGISAVLFDLDGTLVDSAPDLAGAVNLLRERRGLASLPYERLRPGVGSGARGMIGLGFGLAPGDEGFEPLRDEFLAVYERGLLERTAVFAEMAPVLDAIEAAGLPWGIVTNKAERFTFPVVRGLGLDTRAGAVVCGDTTPHSKPHPAPLLEAARRMAVEAAACVYVGDDLRDVQAGRGAGMRTLAAGWGYLGHGASIERWGADALLDRPGALLNWLHLA